MNLSEHPQTLDLNKRIALSVEVDDEVPFVTALVIFPVQGPVMGSIRKGDTPGLFVMTANTDIGGTGKPVLMDFNFTADKPISIAYPELEEPKSRIIS